MAKPFDPPNPVIPGESDTDRRNRGREMVRRYGEMKVPDARFDRFILVPMGQKPRANTQDKHDSRLKRLRQEFSPEAVAKAKALRGS